MDIAKSVYHSPRKIPNFHSSENRQNAGFSKYKKDDDDQEIVKEYQSFLENMISSNYIERVQYTKLHAERSWYLTHHAVYHKQKNKLRIFSTVRLNIKGPL